MEQPGDCSPSRSVVSKISTRPPTALALAALALAALAPAALAPVAVAPDAPCRSTARLLATACFTLVPGPTAWGRPCPVNARLPATRTRLPRRWGAAEEKLAHGRSFKATGRVPASAGPARKGASDLPWPAPFPVSARRPSRGRPFVRKRG